MGYNGKYDKNTFYNWCTEAEAAFGKVQSDYEEWRQYYENDQAPDNVPKTEEYIIENKLTDLTRRLVGQIISGKVKLSINSTDEEKEKLDLLIENIQKDNHFTTEVIENSVNHFYVEGFAGIKFRYNPFKISKYGIGSPEIFALKPGQLLLDPTALSPMHLDDRYRINTYLMPLSYAKERWPEKADEITQSSDDNGTYAEDESNRKCRMYEIEFKETFFTEVDSATGGKIKIEKDVYHIVKVINKTVVVEGPDKTGYDTYRLIPLIHTPREADDFGRYPIGIVGLLKQKQNQINVVSSLMSKAIKEDIKTLALIQANAMDKKELVNDYKREAGKLHGVLVLPPDSKVNWAPKTGLAPSLIQMKEILNHDWDEISGKFAPSRGEVKGDISGKAIGLLQSRDIMGEYVAQNHLEFALQQLGEVLLTCIKKEMNTPFALTKREGHDVSKIEYNTDFKLSEIEGEVSVEIEMNSIDKANIEMEKAMALFKAGQLSSVDLLKAFYPNSWRSKITEKTKEDQAYAIVRDLAQLDPRLMQQIMQQIEQLKQMMKEQGNVQQNQQI